MMIAYELFGTPQRFMISWPSDGSRPYEVRKYLLEIEIVEQTSRNAL
jgi:hypothetical protein